MKILHSRYSLFLWLALALVGCGKDKPEVSPQPVLLSRIEEVGKPFNLPQEVLLRYWTFEYNSKGRLVKHEEYNWNASDKTSLLSRSYSIEYGQDDKISKIADRYGAVITCTWSGSTLTVVNTPAGGNALTMVFTLNGDGLPIRRLIGTRVTEVQYDANGNVQAELNNGVNLSPDYVKEYDTSKLDPYSSSFELRFLPVFLSDESFVGRSRNWVARTLYQGSPTRMDETIVEANEQGYPTSTKRLTSNNLFYTKTYTYMHM